jgi:predicted ATPase/DNA-binding SARP family transcriptional activator
MRFAGDCTVGAGDSLTEACAVPTRQGRLVLARLALAERPVTQDELADVLWSETVPGGWERHLAAVVSKLRRLLGLVAGTDATIIGRPGCYELRLPPRSVVDVLEARAAVRDARTLLGAGRLHEAHRSAAAAAGTLRQPFLPGTDALWVDEEREALRTVLLHALDVSVEAAIRLCDADGVELAREAIAVDPYREAAYGQLMRLLVAIGEPAAAEVAFEQCRVLFEVELGIAPSPELINLRPPQVVPEDASPPRQQERAGSAGLDGGRSGRRLPVASTTFIGRDETLAEVVDALERSRLVTLTGTGGVGKSRLALETARRIAARYRDGARLCELAHLAEGDAVVFAVAGAAGVRQQTRAAMEDSLLEALADRHVLIIVDNCEHVLDAVVALLERIGRHCPNVQLLATSRERLAADGELVVMVPPLEVPRENADPVVAWTSPAPALALLRDRIDAVRPGLRLDDRHRVATIEIARRLDGLPLALELAAAQVGCMGPAEVAERLDRRFALLTRGRRSALPRHRTLYAAVDWSVGLLDGPQRRVFERCSVFYGGFALEAAEAVCAVAAGVRSSDVADIVAALVDKSMLTLDDTGATSRYRMLETLRQFGHDQLAANDELTLIERAHAQYYVDVAKRAESGLAGPDEAKWVALLEAELANLGAAHAWCRRTGDVSTVAQLSAALFWFGLWRTRTDVLAWSDSLVDADPSDAGACLPQALRASGTGAWMRGDLSQATRFAKRATAAAAHTPAALYGIHVLGVVALFEGRLTDAAEGLTHAARLAREIEDRSDLSCLLGTVALVHGYAGDRGAALASAEASRLEAARIGSPAFVAWAAYALGEVLSVTDPDAALVHLDRAVALADTVAAHFIRGVALLSATTLRARHGEPAAAAQALLELMDHWEQAGNWRQQWVTLRHAIELFARLGDDEAAATMLGAVETSDSVNLYGADAERLAAVRSDLLARLGADSSALLAQGLNMSAPQAVAFARSRLTNDISNS